MTMWKAVRFTTYGLILLAVVLLARACRHASSPVSFTSSSQLAANEVRRIEVNTNTSEVRVTTRSGNESVSKVTEGVRKVQVTQDSTGQVTVLASNHGYTFEPGLSGFVANDGPRAGLDVCLYYWNRLDFLLGVGFNNRLHDTVGYLAIGYTPAIELLSNTDFFVGVGTNKSLVAGVRVAF